MNLYQNLVCYCVYINMYQQLYESVSEPSVLLYIYMYQQLYESVSEPGVLLFMYLYIQLDESVSEPSVLLYMYGIYIYSCMNQILHGPNCSYFSSFQIVLDA